MRFAFAAALLVYAILARPSFAADSVSTAGDCSPPIVHSTVGGNVTVNCTEYREQIAPIVQSIESVAKVQKMTYAQETRLFDAVNTLLEALLLKENRLITDVTKAHAGIKHIAQAVADLQTSSRDSITVNGSADSANQSGGVTAGYIGVVNQNAPLDRTKFTTPLTGFYAQGVGVRIEMISASTDTAIEAAAKDATAWTNNASVWIGTNMGQAAQALFVDSTNALSFSYAVPNGAQVTSANAQARERWLNSFNSLLPNLKTLIASHDYDPPVLAPQPTH